MNTLQLCDLHAIFYGLSLVIYSWLQSIADELMKVSIPLLGLWHVHALGNNLHVPCSHQDQVFEVRT